MRANRALLVAIRASHARSHATYGSPRVHADLRTQGMSCSRGRVARLMRKDGLRAKTKRRFRVTTTAEPRLPVAENLLARRFFPYRANEA